MADAMFLKLLVQALIMMLVPLSGVLSKVNLHR